MKSTLSKRQLITEEALTWLNTPYQHQARIKGVGVDCAMLVVGVALNVGLINQHQLINISNYPRDWHIHNDVPVLTNVMKSFGCEKIENDQCCVGDIVVFKLGRVPSHLGILLENNNIIHAYAGTVQSVVVNRLDGQWKKRWIETYKFPGV